MSVDRREFLKLAGLTTAAGVAVGRGADVLGQESSTRQIKLPDPDAYQRSATGKRLAMVIDLNKWTTRDAAACTAVCHSIHNVPDLDDPSEEIKWIWTEEFAHAFTEAEEQEHLAERLEHLQVPVLCNHCDHPPCTRVCPTGATWKRDSDGVVMMDWHRCIGCRYCIAACPYGSRSFNWRDPRPYIATIDNDYPTRQRGVVEKCNLCEERLARRDENGKPLEPACVEACQEHGSGAMVFGDLNDEHSEVRKLLAEHFTIRRKVGLGTQPEIYYIV